MTFTHSFTVEGVGNFPWDMLRYDECFPAREFDAGTLERFHRPIERGRGPYEIKLTHVGGVKQWAPNKARWASFGWKVV